MMHVALRTLHITAGSAALLVAAATLVMKKGTPRHRALGQVFVFAGRLVIVSAVVSATWGVVDVDSFLGNDLSTNRAEVRVFMGVLGVLGFLSALDLENGLNALRAKPAPLLTPLALACGVSGLALSVWGASAIVEGTHGLTWFALAIGGIGVHASVTQLRRASETTPPIQAHLTGMIGAASAFLAAFSLFGLGRLAPVDLLSGNAITLAPVIVVIAGGQLLTRWWCARWDTRATALPAAAKTA